MLPGFH